MFHTFEAQSQSSAQGPPPSVSGDERTAGPRKRRRARKTRACQSCRRRKTYCDGDAPCGTCKWYRKSAQCSFVHGDAAGDAHGDANGDEARAPLTTTRQATPTGISCALRALWPLTWASLHRDNILSPSLAATRLTAKRSNGLDTSAHAGPGSDSAAVLGRLFPGSAPQDLAGLSREQLLEKLKPRPDGHDEDHDADRDSQEEARALEQLQDFPESRTAAPSRPQSPSARHGVTDDINALALAPSKARSYLGVSSVGAVLRIILLLDPDSTAFASTASGPNASSGPARGKTLAGRRENQQLAPKPSSPSSSSSPPPPAPAAAAAAAAAGPTLEHESQPTLWDEVPAINAYFTFVHPQIPLLDEADFRACYAGSTRADARWQLLLNAVLAMGSVAASTADDGVHRVFYERARQRLDLAVFAAAHLETVQALIILGGMYLHYAQQPHLANCLVGATFRMATALGLHRDYSEAASASRSPGFARAVEVRRRVWWSLCCLDACNSNFLGRPTLGRMGRGRTTQRPQSPVSNNPAITALLNQTIDYCEISTRMDNYLADHSVLGRATRQELDAALLGWLNSNPPPHPPASPGDTHHPGLAVARNVLRWRCQSARIFVYRPILLWHALRREPAARVSPAKREAIRACRRIAADLIDDIAASWRAPLPCVMAGWHATWLLYQTSMVPLLSLFCDGHRPDVAAACRAQVERVIATLDALGSWSCTAPRSLEVVTRLYSASQAYREKMQQQQQQQDDEAQGGATAALPRENTADAVQAAANPSGEAPEIPSLETPLTNVSGSAEGEFLLGDFFDDMSWMDGHEQSLQGVGNDLAFLDHYDI